jgi:hypothetical protein
MNNRKTSTIFLAAALGAALTGCGHDIASSSSAVTATEPAMMGDERGNGAEYIRADDGSAWFFDGSRKIRYCMTIAPSFGTDAGRAQNAIKSAFATWEKYLVAKDRIGLKQKPGFRFATELVYLPSCDGTEDLSFKFGILDAESTSHLKDLRTPVALAVRTAYDPKTRWGKGFVWLASQGSLGESTSPKTELGTVQTKPLPDWKGSNSVEGIILHEVGHIFGNEHIPGTIMQEYIVHAVEWLPEADRQRFLTQIDWYFELVPSATSCNAPVKGTLGFKGLDPFTGTPYDTTPDNFKLLTGRASVGRVSSEYTTSSCETGFATLIVSDDDDRFVFPIFVAGDSAISIAVGRNRTLKAVYWDDPSQGLMTWFLGEFSSSSMLGSLSTSMTTGQRLQVIVDNNMMTSIALPPGNSISHMWFFDASHTIRLFDGQSSRILFTTAVQ